MYVHMHAGDVYSNESIGLLYMHWYLIHVDTSADMAWKQKSKEARMTSCDFSDYPSSEGMEENSRTPGGRKPFSPIAEEECENDGDHMTSKPRPRNNTVSPRSSMSPNHSSVSPVSSGSDHSSRSPPTTHLPPPSSQPPPLPPSHTRPHPQPPPHSSPRINAHISTKRLGSNSAPGLRTPQQHHPSGHVTGHVTLAPRSRKPYENHHIHYPKHTVGPIPPSQHSSGVSGQYHWVPRPSGVGKPSYGPIIQDAGQSNSSVYAYDPVAPSNSMGVVNSKLVPTKMYPTVTETAHLTNSHLSNRGSPDNGTNEVLIDPGERGSPSGESSPSSTPNSTLGKQIHRHMMENIHAESKHGMGRDGVEDEVKVQHNTTRGATKVQMGKISLSIPNTRHHVNSHTTHQKPAKTMRTLEARKNDCEDAVRQIRTNVALKVSQFNQNGNHSGGATRNDKDTSPTNDKDKSSSNGSAGPSPVGGASKISPTHSGTVEVSPSRIVGDSRSSSVEELAIINDDDQTDSAHSEMPILKPDPSKSKPHPPSGGQGHYPPPPHHPHHHTEPYPPYVSLSQPPPQGVPQGITQGIVPPPSLSQQDHRYMYDPHRAELAYTTHTGMYPAHSSMAYEAAASRHHHISPPHSSQAHSAHSSQAHAPHQYIVPSAHHGYRPPPHDYIGSHDHHPGSHDHHPGPHDHHMTHRGLPPGMQYMRSDQQYSPAHHMTSKLPRHEPFSKNNVSLAHEAAANGDIKTLHHMLSSHEVDTYGSNEHHFSLAHKAALHGRLPVIQFLVESGLPPSALQIPDDSFTTPAMLAIQGGSVECLQWLVEETKIPFQVRDTGGETLMHHAAFHGQAKCLEWLLKTVKKRNEQSEVSEILDESGVTPAHFAAQGGHLDCLQLLMDFGYSMVHTDRENQKPVDWADAMGQNICVRYLMMYETCWALSGELTHMAEQLAIVQKENGQLRDTFSSLEKDHESAITKLLTSHEERLTKMREHHVDLMASILHMNQDTPPTGGGGATAPTTNKKGQGPVRKAPPEPPTTPKRSSNRPPIPPDPAAKKRSRGSKDRGHEAADKGEDHNAIDYRTATPQQVLEKQMTSVAQRMNANREARKRGGGMTRTFSPLTPIIQRLYSKSDEADSKSERSSRSQRHTEDARRSAPKVKFSKTITEFPDYSRYDNPTEVKSVSSPGQSPSHSHHGKLDGDSLRVKGESSEHNSRKSSEK